MGSDAGTFPPLSSQSDEPTRELTYPGFGSAGSEEGTEAVDADLDLLKKEGTELEVLKRVPTTLQNLQTMQLTVRYKSLTSGEAMMQDLITAIRNRKEETGIVYEIGLRTPESRYAEDSTVFKQIIKTWASKSLPR
jgi:hypothetical protein